VLVIIRLLLLVALGVSAYLAWVSLTHGMVAGCGPESDCDRVLNSRWSSWFGVPVSLFALVVDAVALWSTFALRGPTPEGRRRGALAGAAAAMMILGAGFWFIALQLFSVGFCPYCMTAHGAGVIAAVLLLATLGKAGGETAVVWKRAGAGAFAALLVLVAGQAAQKPPTGRATRILTTVNNVPSRVVVPVTNPPAPPPAPTNPPPAVVQAPPALPPVPPVAPVPTTNAPRPSLTPQGIAVAAMQRPFRFYEGVFALDLMDVPIMGSPAAPHAIISLFDYSCHHCRITHPALHEVQRQFSNELVIVSLPMPLDGQCNHTVLRTPRAHTNACAYARVGLTVWRANREKHREFDDWMMTGTEPPPMADCVQRATALVGTNAFVTALQDGWVERQLQFDIAVYELAYRQQHGSMPQIIVGPTVFEGTARPEDILKLLAQHLGLKRDP
jgi:uncharacterized membrane protein